MTGVEIYEEVTDVDLRKYLDHKSAGSRTKVTIEPLDVVVQMNMGMDICNEDISLEMKRCFVDYEIFWETTVSADT